MEQQLLDYFYHLHQHPELSNEEVNTTAYIKSILGEHGIDVLDLALKTGLVASIGPKSSERVIALRCDIDALPIHEETGLCYQSTVGNVMHACGHDFHTTVMLGTAILLKSIESQLNVRVKILFQPAEEINSGAKDILSTGVLDDVDEIYGLHCSPYHEVGVVAIKAGSVTAAVDRFKIVLKGKGGHAATPHLTLDPIPLASQIVLSAQSIVSRSINPFHQAVLSFTRLTAGSTWNVIPDDAILEGTVRTHDAEDRRLIETSLCDLTRSLATAQGFESEFTWIEGPPATRNDLNLSAYAKEIASAVGFDVSDTLEEQMIGEDFAYYSEQIPGCFVMVGTGLSKPLHNSQFQVDPTSIRKTVEFFAEVIKQK